MNVQKKTYRTIWLNPENKREVLILDQTKLPHGVVSDLIVALKNVEEVEKAILHMQVRGAGLIGVTAAFGMYLAALEAEEKHLSFSFLEEAGERLKKTRPTAVNLSWAVERQLKQLLHIHDPKNRTESALAMAQNIAEEDVQACKKIGEFGVGIIREIAAQKKNKEPVHILTHCNAGWLAFVEHGTATSPIYQAFKEKIPIHVWVDETRPRCQGSSLTAWELQACGVPHTIIVDNTGGHLMQHKKVDLVITGADRVTYTGDVANKIGTYLKALAAFDNHVPFYVAFPSSTFDWEKRNGIEEIPIEERHASEIEWVEGLLPEGKISKVRLTPLGSSVLNYGFDVTPARFITGLITERGICNANEEAVFQLFPEKKVSLI